MSDAELGFVFRESRRLFDLAIFVRRLDANPAHGAVLARKALYLLARVVQATYDRTPEDPSVTWAKAQELNVEHRLFELDLERCHLLLNRLAEDIDSPHANATEQDRRDYDELLEVGPRIYAQAAAQLGHSLPSRPARGRVALLGLTCASLLGLAALAFRILDKHSAEPDIVPAAAPHVTTQSAGTPLPGLKLPTTLELNAAQAAQGPLGEGIRVIRSPGVHRAIIEARGTPCPNPGSDPSDPRSKYPAIEMRIDGMSAHVWYLDSEGDKRYASDAFTLDDGPHTVRFFSVNDYYEEGHCDRNVWLERVTFEPAKALPPSINR